MRHGRWLVLLVVTACCSLPTLLRPNRVPAPLQAGAPSAEDGAASVSWSFERGLEDWVVDSGSIAPTCAPVTAQRLRTTGGAPVVGDTPGGDYWQTAVDIAQVGACRIDTAGVGSAGVALHSPDFPIVAPFFSMRVGGGGHDGTRVELQLQSHGYAAVRSDRGPGTIAMHTVVWDTSDLKGEIARLAIVDDGSSDNGLLVDAAHDSRLRPTPRAAPLWGFADMHAHPVSQLGFGKHVSVGANDGPIDQALHACNAEHDLLGGKAGPLMELFEESYDGLPGHNKKGYPAFAGWPRFSTQAHQQMYVDWIRRAWQGGLRLMVAHAVNNEELASVFNGDSPYDDLHVVKAELDAMKALVSRHGDFMEIAYTPADARRIIENGKLAIVLGVEVDSVGNCRRDSDCSEAQLRTVMNTFYGWGARHVFPVHLADNPVGGTAVYHGGEFAMLSWYLRDEYQQVEHDDSVSFRYTRGDQGLPVIFAQLTGKANLYGHHPYEPPLETYEHVLGGHVNKRGLTAAGAAVIDEMIKLGIIIDIDHMGQRTRRDVLQLAIARHVPVAMGHSWYRELGFTRLESNDPQKLRNDAMKTPEELEAVRVLGGAIAPITNQGDVRRVEGSGVETDCASASTSWLQAYVYAVQRMQGRGVGLGTDFNGLAQEPSPRFGPWACIGRNKHGQGDDDKRREPGMEMDETIRHDADAQQNGVSYASEVLDAKKHRFWGAAQDAPYSEDERNVWMAIATWKANADPAKDHELEAGERATIGELVRGFRDTHNPGDDDWRAAAFLVKSGAPEPASPSSLRKRYRTVLAIWKQWQRMGSGNHAAPLQRSMAGDRDFDVNLDGLAHYGLLPDFLQDVSNQLRAGHGSVTDLSALFRSAEAYVAMWERVEAASGH